MGVKLSIFTTVTDPIRRGDCYHPAIQCYANLADEVTIIDGLSLNGRPTKIHDWTNKLKIITKKWPYEFNWKHIGETFQKGYESSTGDWVIHADLDFIFHEKDFVAIRKACEDNPNTPALSFWKFQFILPDRYNLKSRLVVAVNKSKYGDRIRFDSGGDLCQPSLDGKELSPDDVPEARVPIYNYECLLKTKEQLLEDKGRMARAWQRHFGEYKLGGPDDQSAYDEWHNMVVGRFGKPHKNITLDEHPRYVRETIKNLEPEQWGYSGFGLIGGNDYAHTP